MDIFLHLFRPSHFVQFNPLLKMFFFLSQALLSKIFFFWFKLNQQNVFILTREGQKMSG